MRDIRFSFGKNWSKYVDEVLDEERINLAVTALQELLMVDNLQGETFIDIGSGSGLHSLAAYRLGAKQIISFDYDVDSVATTARLRERVGNPAHWQVLQGSILDVDVVERYRGNIVYSWGVLHHTGAMWQAIRNAANMVESGGLFCIAIYQTEPSTPRWQNIKRTYVQAPRLIQHLMVYGYEVYVLLRRIFRGQMPWQVFEMYKARGMNWHHDMIDWIGGYPFETATEAELRALCEGELGMNLIKHIPPTVQGGLNEMTFRLKAL